MITLSVFDTLNYIKNIIDTDNNLRNIIVSGEISNFHKHTSGHLYFSLKDDKARINCVMFKSYTTTLRFLPKDGDKVLIKAAASVFVSSGQLQLYVSEIKKDGIGDLYIEFEKLKNKLAAQGLFDPAHKKKSPLYPMRLAILCGEKSAALSDIETCLKRRWPLAFYDVYPVLVQGPLSSDDIISTLDRVDEMDYDAIVLARGGGSIEDLWSFNDEKLAQKIFAIKTFIVTGIGHEQDYTIADFVADLRAPTPTAAIELITPDIKDIRSLLKTYNDRLINSVNKELSLSIKRYDSLSQRPLFKQRYYLTDKQSQSLDYLKVRLYNYQNVFISVKRDLRHLKEILLKSGMNMTAIQDNRKQIFLNRLNSVIKYKYETEVNRLKRNQILLKAYGVSETLGRGYALVSKDDKIIKDIKEVKTGDILNIRLFNGRLEAIVKDKGEEDEI